MGNTESAPILFEPGAPASPGNIPLCVPRIQGNEWKYIKECLDANWVSSAGPFVSRFEHSVADYLSAKQAVATVSGTAALHVALLAAGVEADEEVLVSALTFIAPVNAVRYVGAWPVFIDAEPSFWQMDAAKVADFITKECLWANGRLQNKKTGRRVKAIVPVHILGHPVDIDPILKIARRFDLAVIEDAAESLGAKYKGRMVGNLADMACISFNGNKIVTTGGGGMLMTNNGKWADQVRYLTTKAKDDPVEYIHDAVGYNYRLTNIAAAMGCAQMEQLDKFVEDKRRIAKTYAEGLKNIKGLGLMVEAPWADATFWLYTVVVDENKFGISSRALMGSLKRANIQTRPLWQPLHLSKAHRGCQAYHVEVAGDLYKNCLSLPSSVGIEESQIMQVIESIKKSSKQVNT